MPVVPRAIDVAEDLKALTRPTSPSPPDWRSGGPRMRAVNLVPPEARAGRVSPGKSGGAVYGVIGALVVALLMMSSLALVKKQKAAADQELAAVRQSTQAYEQVATQFAAFEKASKDANDRIELVRSLAQARFDWAGTLRDMARLIPHRPRFSSSTRA